MAFTWQRILADTQRGDGHDANGNPGDCLRTCVANLTGEPYEQVPHFAQHIGWWDLMRRWARERGADFGCVLPRDGSVRYAITGGSGLYIGSGPSPRGAFNHVVLVDADLDLVHDPHPSGAGLVSVNEVLAYCLPYYPAPGQLALVAA